MKATGVVRRIDDLGRIVVPKEIRRTLRIREGDPLLTTLTEYSNSQKNAQNKGLQDIQFVNSITNIADRIGEKYNKE